MIPNLLEKYRKEIVPQMREKFGYKSPMQVPAIKKVVVNMGVGEAIADIKILDKAQEELAMITGQKPIRRVAKAAIANFKTREGVPVGCKVTLRNRMMYEFLDRLINATLPRIRDFRGIPANSFDQQGNYSMGLKDQSVFPEIDIDRLPRVQGMDITIVTSARNNKEAYELLKLFGMPFSRQA
ncbi:MAG: 50S ribosomal protein L5 [Omnitrophica WOR_2 bacterium GWB2_45_9]|nr:MAG: 50S ribosomal protein L5 [Omnitrophica WOR_2 bacterium GWB2_45_9]OGX45701.1 MAG: 50S ribosomal protein L5 [Omnitrophica WOR_2 bacterium RIFOXYA2_FULL_45_12]OGX53941.1 MAG: 50S ribosomal protein L5 [Omnitrophica WOR_2 bacterium RIFOXYB2_FULL_45_11]OGX61234.1 MAG: 50S ribosomal protein L5 [Omnitrophica WOR_2 bacterium RIFOXYC2_FULL_45_15]